MRIRTSSGSRLRLGGRLFSGVPAASGPAIGEIVRVTNIGVTPSEYSYTDIDGITQSQPVNPGDKEYILALSGSVSDNYDGAPNELVAIRLLITGSAVGGQFTEELITTTGAGTWTKPVGVTEVIAECWGGGGGGGNAATNQSGGGGGSGGYYSRKLILFSSAQQTINLSVGTGGAAINDGLPTFFNGTTVENSSVVAVGGIQGQSNGTELTPAQGGTNAIFGSVGDVIYQSGEGNPGEYVGPEINAAFGGSGGFGAGSTGTFNTELGGEGSDGINAITSGVNGNPGNNYGGGGGGAAKISGPNRTGGAGAQGLIRLIYR